jgi:hypothetical protein
MTGTDDSFCSAADNAPQIANNTHEASPRVASLVVRMGILA